MNKVKTILIDGLILFAVSTCFVWLVNKAFDLVGGHGGPKADPVVTAINQNDTEKVRELLGNPKNSATLLDEHGRTALMRAAFVNLSSAEETAKSDEKRAEMIPMLLDHGATVDARDHDGWTALMWASWSGLPKTVGQLLDHNASLPQPDKLGNTALTLAAQRGNADIVRLLLDKGAGKSARTDAGMSALDLAKEGMTEYPGEMERYQKIISLLEAGTPENTPAHPTTKPD